MSGWLITGASGSLGRSIIKRLQADNVEIFCADVRGEEVVHCDVTDSNQIHSMLGSVQPDYLVHLAATFSHDIDLAYRLNVQSSQFILESVETLGLKTRVVLIGSAAEYGLVRPEENPIPIGHALNPVSIYGMSKAWQTHLASYFSSRGVDVVIARIFNLDGPGMSEALFAGRVRRQARELLTGVRRRIEVGPLSAVRDYLTTDAAALQLIAVAQRGCSAATYHIASGIPITMSELLNRLLTEYGLNRSVVDEARSLSNRQGLDVPVVYADISTTLPLLSNGVLT
jgi:nucleoside-diphosphate-sugar epimerase